MALAGEAGLLEKLVSEKPWWLCKAKGHRLLVLITTLNMNLLRRHSLKVVLLTGLQAEVSQEVTNLDELHLLL